MEDINPVAIGVPIFLIAIVVEIIAAKRRNVKAFRFVDSITNMSCGVGNQMVLVLVGAALYGFHGWTYDNFSLVRFEPGSPWPWVIAIVGVDFIYYWWHRYSHEVNVMWAAHVVHHQSEDYNLAVALRQALFTNFTSTPFYLLLAFVGVPAEPLIASVAISLLYQFWIHTELIKKLPAPLEYVLNTPSHHRVHHATNTQYLDKNYGAILISWDRMFGTFEPEVEPCIYGITSPLKSFNPVWANFQYWQEIAGLVRRAPTWQRKLKAIVARPGWDPVTNTIEVPTHVPREQFVKFDVPEPSRRLVGWVVLQFALVAVALIAVLLFGPTLPWPQLVAIAAVILAASVAWGGLFEQRRWAPALEAARIGASALILGWVFLA